MRTSHMCPEMEPLGTPQAIEPTGPLRRNHPTSSAQTGQPHQPQTLLVPGHSTPEHPQKARHQEPSLHPSQARHWADAHWEVDPDQDDPTHSTASEAPRHESREADSSAPHQESAATGSSRSVPNQKQTLATRAQRSDEGPAEAQRHHSAPAPPHSPHSPQAPRCTQRHTSANAIALIHEPAWMTPSSRLRPHVYDPPTTLTR